MANDDADDVRQFFTDLVPDDLIDVYSQLLASGGTPKEEVGEILAADDVRRLTSLGMAHMLPHTATNPATFQPASPELAMHGVLAGLQARLAELQQQLKQGHRRLEDAQSRPIRVCLDTPEHQARIITDPNEVTRTSMHLVNSSHKDWMTIESTNTEMSITEDFPVDASAALRQKKRIRSIYDMRFTEHPLGSQFIECSVKAGEEARVLTEVPMKMQLADESAVLLPLTENGARAAVLIKYGPIPRALRLFFEMLWTSATPYGPAVTDTGPLTDTQLKLLQLMALGKSDKGIGAKLNISESTVRRHIKDIADKLGTPYQDRFQFGVAVGRSGWLS